MVMNLIFSNRRGGGLLYLVRCVRLGASGEQRPHELGRVGRMKKRVLILIHHVRVCAGLEQRDLELGRRGCLQRRQAGLRSWESRGVGRGK